MTMMTSVSTSARVMPLLETERLMLRNLALENAEDLFRYGSNEHVSRYTTFRTHTSVEDAVNFISAMLSLPEHQFCWGISLKPERTIIGAINFGVKSVDVGDIHYAISEEYWGKGIVTEAAKQVLEFGFNTYPSTLR